MLLLTQALLINRPFSGQEENIEVTPETASEQEAGEAEREITADTVLETATEITTETTTEPTKTESEPASEPEQVIRVLLTTSDYSSYEHAQVSGSCNGQEFLYTPDSIEPADRPVILDGGEEGIVLTSITRQCGSPVYYGTLEIRSDGEGLTLVNVVPLETYLESVVPSEMPSTYHPEALKAQAVCARTYAWKRIGGKGIEGYEADVDDSVSCQVYGNILPQVSASEAVRDTEGLILCQNGEAVDTYYFSTSAGVTSTDEVWGADEAASHLKSVECDFDRDAPWSRWEVTVPWKNPEAELAKLTAQKENLLRVEIRKKSQSGAVTGLELFTENNVYQVETEYKVREFLSPRGCRITEKDGTETTGGNLLPSAYFSMEQYPGEKIVLTGGGYGHGVGMSQNGANAMAEKGYAFEEILEYFFNNTQLEQMPVR